MGEISLVEFSTQTCFLPQTSDTFRFFYPSHTIDLASQIVMSEEGNVNDCIPDAELVESDVGFVNEQCA